MTGRARSAGARPLRAPTGSVTPAPSAPHVEQVGWGVARQVARVLAGPESSEAGSDSESRALLEDCVRLAEDPGHVVYAVFERRTALALALVRLPVPDGVPEATYAGEVLAPGAPAEVVHALLVRALHDLAATGVATLAVTRPRVDVRALGFC